jgi:beta-1,4-galactosyltransferase, putative
MDCPVFSILIPVYNTECYLPRALDSIVNQTFDLHKVEVIVVNDGSPNGDLCDKIVNNYSNTLHIIYIKKNQNEGLYLARKTGVENANGKYYLNLDADDEHSSDAYETLFTVIEKHKDLNLDYIEFQIYEIGSRKQPYTYPICDDRTLDILLQQETWTSMCFRCFNTEFLKKVYSNMNNFYAVTIEDFYQSVICEFYSKNKISIPDFLYNRYLDIGVSSPRYYDDIEIFLKMQKSVENVFYNIYDFFHSKNIYNYDIYLNKFYNKFYIDALKITSNKMVVDIALDKINDRYLYKYLIEQYKELSHTMEKYTALLPIAKRLNKPINLLRNLKRCLKLRKKL